MFCCLISLQSLAQGKFTLQNKIKDRIDFKLINNLIIIPVEVYGVELFFILYTVLSKHIIVNFINLTEELQVNDTELIYLRGLGEGDTVKALKSKNNIFKISNIP